MLETSQLQSAVPVDDGDASSLLRILEDNGDLHLLEKVQMEELAKWTKIYQPFERLADEVKVL